MCSQIADNYRLDNINVARATYICRRSKLLLSGRGCVTVSVEYSPSCIKYTQGCMYVHSGLVSGLVNVYTAIGRREVYRLRYWNTDEIHCTRRRDFVQVQSTICSRWGSRDWTSTTVMYRMTWTRHFFELHWEYMKQPPLELSPRRFTRPQKKNTTSSSAVA